MESIFEIKNKALNACVNYPDNKDYYTIYEDESTEDAATFERFIGKTATLKIESIYCHISICNTETDDDGNVDVENRDYYFDIFQSYISLPEYIIERNGMEKFLDDLSKITKVNYNIIIE